MYLFVAFGIVSIFFILTVDGKHHRKSVEELNRKNQKIINEEMERVRRVKAKTNEILESERVK